MRHATEKPFKEIIKNQEKRVLKTNHLITKMNKGKNKYSSLNVLLIG